MNNQADKPAPRTHHQYYSQEGVVFAHDVGLRFYRELSTVEPAEVTTADIAYGLPRSLDASSGALAVVTTTRIHRAAYQLSHSIIRDSTIDIDAVLGITAEDRDPHVNRATFGLGLADLDFAAGFMPLVASEAVDFLVKSGRLSHRARCSMSLSDWADVIASDWFDSLIHDMAFAPNGTYGTYGANQRDFTHGNFEIRVCNELNIKKRPLFAPLTSPKNSNAKHRTPLQRGVHLAAEIHHRMRERMVAERSPGCPAARGAGAIALHSLERNSHVQALREGGDLDIVRTHGDHGVAHFSMNYTAMQAARDYVVDSLRRYDAAFGTPYFEGLTRTLHHEHGGLKLGALRVIGTLALWGKDKLFPSKQDTP